MLQSSTAIPGSGSQSYCNRTRPTLKPSPRSLLHFSSFAYVSTIIVNKVVYITLLLVSYYYYYYSSSSSFSKSIRDRQSSTLYITLQHTHTHTQPHTHNTPAHVVQ